MQNQITDYYASKTVKINVDLAKPANTYACHKKSEFLHQLFVVNTIDKIN